MNGQILLCHIRHQASEAVTAGDACANLHRLMDQAAESHQPIAITGKRRDAVQGSGAISDRDDKHSDPGGKLLAEEDGEAIQETLK